jgi:hypothetical protein
MGTQAFVRELRSYALTVHDGRGFLAAGRFLHLNLALAQAVRNSEPASAVSALTGSS